jgi:hypothetical protein
MSTPDPRPDEPGEQPVPHEEPDTEHEPTDEPEGDEGEHAARPWWV